MSISHVSHTVYAASVEVSNMAAAAPKGSEVRRLLLEAEAQIDAAITTLTEAELEAELLAALEARP